MKTTPRNKRLQLLLGLGVLACWFACMASSRASHEASNTDPLLIAKTFFEAGKYTEAQPIFNEIAATEPENAEAVFYLGWVAFRLNQTDESIKFLEKATSLDATKSLYFHVLGDAYGIALQRASIFSKPGWAKKCLAAYDRSVALDPDNLDVRRARCEFYRHAPTIAGGGMDKAYAEAAEIRKRNPLHGAMIMSELYITEKKFSEAFKLLDEAVVENPGNKAILYQLGRLAAKSGQQFDRGEAALKEYLLHTPLPHEPPLHEAHWRLGTLYQKKGAKAAARAEYEAALQLQPGYQKALESLSALK